MATYNPPRFPLFPSHKSITNLFLVLTSPIIATDTTENSTTTTTSDSNESPAYRISLGLVEISALATLIGGTNAESLALGLVSACGLPWASISTFGALHVVKASLAAAVPDNIREALGLRNSVVDSAIGINSRIDTTKSASRSVDLGGPCAVLLSYNEGGVLERQNFRVGTDYSLRALVSEKVPVPWAVYAFEKVTAGVLGNIPSTGAGEPVEVYQSSKDRGPDGMPDTVTDYVVLLASLVKLVEVYALWRAGATALCWVAGLGWLHGFVSALGLQIARLERDDERLGQVDVLAGELPSPLFPGGSRRVLLGLPRNVKRHYGWKIVWGTGAAVNVLAVLWTFVLLGAQSTDTVYVWVGFQGLWLLVRTLMYNFLATRYARRGIMVSQSWDVMRVGVRKRVVNLILALAKQQITIHPRGVHTYQEDLIDAASIAGLLQKAEFRLTESLPLGTTSKNPSTGITIIGAVGDTVLRSTAWVRGISLANPDLYDCVLAFVSISGRVYAVPSVRVLSGIPEGDIEDRVSSFEPRGTSNNGLNISWQYWVPAVDDILGSCWLEARGMRVKESKTVVLTHKQLGAKLMSGTLNISLATVPEIERILEESRKGSDVLLKVLMDSEIGVSTEVIQGKKWPGYTMEIKECDPES